MHEVYQRFATGLVAIWTYLDQFVVTDIKLNYAEVTAISSLIIAVFLLVLTCAVRRLAKISKMLARAFLNVRAAGVYMLRDINECVAQVEIINTGNLPATKTKCFIKAELLDKRDWKIMIGGHGLLTGNYLVPPHAKMRQGSENRIPIGPEFLRRQENLFLYVWGAVTYDDGFGKRRTITFCHRYNCANLTPQPQWGSPIIGRIHARDNRYGNTTY